MLAYVPHRERRRERSRFVFVDSPAVADRPNWSTLAKTGLTAKRDCVVGVVDVLATNPYREFGADVPIFTAEGLYVHPARTNLQPYSEDVGSWSSLVNVTVIDDDSLSPVGAVEMSEITDTATSAAHYVQHNWTPGAVAQHCASLFGSAGTEPTCRVTCGSGSAANFDLNAGSYSAAQDGAFIEAVGAWGWRYGVIFSPPDTTAQIMRQYFRLGTSYAGGSGTQYIWGAQVEQAASAGPYIPTAGATASSIAPVYYIDDTLALHRLSGGRLHLTCEFTLDEVASSVIPLLCVWEDASNYMDVKFTETTAPSYTLTVGDVVTTDSSRLYTGRKYRLLVAAWPDGAYRIHLVDTTTDTVEDITESGSGLTWSFTTQAISRLYIGCLNDESGQTFQTFQTLEVH